MKINYRLISCLFFLFAVIMRILLCWVNPPENSFDNHYEPIFLIIKNGVIPAKDACFQCYQPPAFYLVSAMIGKAAFALGARLPQVMKILQFINCLYGILTVALIYLILSRFAISGFARAISFGTICFLPRHIYMSAMNSNDAISYLFVTLCVYLLIVAVEKKLSPLSLLALALSLTVAVFTKYTAFVVLPMTLLIFAVIFWRRITAPKMAVISLLLVILPPLAALSGYLHFNQIETGSLLPWNTGIYDPAAHRPADDPPVNFLTFKPWEDVVTPMLAPGKLHSFWTLIYSGTWFDTEPLFQPFLDKDDDWWGRYYGWYRGEQSYPGDNPSLPSFASLTGSALISLGLFPLAFVIIGGYFAFIRRRHLPEVNIGAADGFAGMFLLLIILNSAGIIAMTLKLPVYCSMKPSYFLNSMSAFAFFLGIGINQLENVKGARRLVAVVFGAIFCLAAVHILQIFAARFSLQ